VEPLRYCEKIKHWVSGINYDEREVIAFDRKSPTHGVYTYNYVVDATCLATLNISATSIES